jgi:hypothetical protein
VKIANNRRKHVRLAYEYNGKPVSPEQGRSLALEASASFQQRSLRNRVARLEIRHRHTPERLSVERAVLAVEERLVKAMWVLERALPNEGARGHATRNGIDYLHEEDDREARYSDAPGGKWESQSPRPALPVSKEIDAALEVRKWLNFLDPLEARILSIGAMSKHGDAGRRVNWVRVKGRLPELGGYSVRSLQGFYTKALREIVAELTVSKLVRG